MLLYERDFETSTLRHDVDPLGHPRRVDATAPQSAFIKEWASEKQLDDATITESAAAELFVFENAKSAKNLEVFVWTLGEEYEGEQTSLHYAFLLRVVDV